MCWLFADRGVEHELLYRSMSSILSCPLGRVSTIEPPVRRRGRSRARGRPRVASYRRQRNLRDDEPAE